MGMGSGGGRRSNYSEQAVDGGTQVVDMSNLCLHERKVKLLTDEMASPDGIVVAVHPYDLIENMAVVEIAGSLWLAI